MSELRWKITKFESPYLVSVVGPDVGGVEVGPVTRAERAEAEVARLRDRLRGVEARAASLESRLAAVQEESWDLQWLLDSERGRGRHGY